MIVVELQILVSFLYHDIFHIVTCSKCNFKTLLFIVLLNKIILFNARLKISVCCNFGINDAMSIIIIIIINLEKSMLLAIFKSISHNISKVFF